MNMTAMIMKITAELLMELIIVHGSKLLRNKTAKKCVITVLSKEHLFFIHNLSRKKKNSPE